VSSYLPSHQNDQFLLLASDTPLSHGRAANKQYYKVEKRELYYIIEKEERERKISLSLSL
jgi:hypothetical protein